MTFRNAVTISDLFFQVSGGNQQTFNVDNLLLSDTAAIPEPASLALLGLGGLLTMSRRRSGVSPHNFPAGPVTTGSAVSSASRPSRLFRSLICPPQSFAPSGSVVSP